MNLLNACFLSLHFICGKVIHVVVSSNSGFIFTTAYNFISSIHRIHPTFNGNTVPVLTIMNNYAMNINMDICMIYTYIWDILKMKLLNC